MKNLLVVLSGPSGVGKGTIVSRLLEKGGFYLSVSCTTRAPRQGEKDGRDYFFISREQFLSEIANGGFLEYSEHFSNFYGTPGKYVEEQLRKGDVLLEIEVDGALQVKKAHPEAILIMIAPPNEQELRARLKKRGSESDEKIEERIKRMDYELSKKHLYDYVVINDNLDDAVEEIANIISRRKGEKK